MKRFLIIILLCLSTFFTSCSTVQKRQNELIRQGVYATQESINKGRIDLADKYVNQLTKIVPPPAKKIPVQTFQVKRPVHGNVKTGENVKIYAEGQYFKEFDTKLDSEPFVVLPERLKDKPVIVENSPEFVKLVDENKDLKKQLEKERATIASFESKIEDVQRDKEKIVEKASKKSGIWGWVTGLGITGIAGIIGIIALCVFFPALMPILASIFTSIVSGVNGILRVIGKLFNKSQ